MAWTYFVQSVDGGPIKIGKTTQDPEQRLAGLQTGSPVKLRFVGLIEEDRESDLHAKYAKDRLHGEWFHPSKELLDYIREETSEALHSRLTDQAEMEISGSKVAIANVDRHKLSESYFDAVLPNDDDLFERFSSFCDWDEGQEWDGEGEICEAELVSNYIDNMAIAVNECGSFVESVGINEERGYVGFICGPCNNSKRRALLDTLAEFAHCVDGITGRWCFFALVWDGGKDVGVELLPTLLYGKPICFDPREAFRSELSCA